MLRFGKKRHVDSIQGIFDFILPIIVSVLNNKQETEQKRLENRGMQNRWFMNDLIHILFLLPNNIPASTNNNLTPKFHHISTSNNNGKEKGKLELQRLPTSSIGNNSATAFRNSLLLLVIHLVIIILLISSILLKLNPKHRFLGDMNHKRGQTTQILRNNSFGEKSHLHIWSPQSQIIPQQLHDKSTVLVRFFSQSVKLSNSFIESLRKKWIWVVWKTENLKIWIPV